MIASMSTLARARLSHGLRDAQDVCALTKVGSVLNETQRVLCCKKLASDQPSSWKTILMYYLKPVNGKLVLCCNFELQKLPITLPKFYEERLKSFAKCSAAIRGSVQKLNGNDLAKLFFGIISLFVLKESLCISKKMAEKGIIKIGDLVSDNNELIVKNNRRLRELNISGHSMPLDFLL